MLTYKIIEAKEDPKDSIIEKSGHVIKFSIRDIETHLADLKKTKMGQVAQMNFTKAQMANIEKFHPYVLDFNPLQLFALHMYMEKKSEVEGIEKNIEKIDKSLAEYDADCADILAQIPELKPVEVAEVPESSLPKMPTVDTDKDLIKERLS